jgi:hypothetical protein
MGSCACAISGTSKGGQVAEKLVVIREARHRGVIGYGTTAPRKPRS